MATETITLKATRTMRQPDAEMRLEMTELAYDALCVEQEKLAALIGVLKQALKDGLNGMPAESIYGYLTVLTDQQKTIEARATTLYETAIAHG